MRYFIFTGPRGMVPIAADMVSVWKIARTATPVAPIALSKFFWSL